MAKGQRAGGTGAMPSSPPHTRYRDLARKLLGSTDRMGSSDGGHPLADQRHPCSGKLLLSENGLAAFPGRSTRQEL